MLYYYASAAADNNNWLHGWFVDAFTAAMNAIDAGEEPADWDSTTAIHAASLRNRPALRADFEALIEAYKAASGPGRTTTRTALQAQNDLPLACMTGLSVRVAALPAPIAAAAVALGERLFGLLKDLNIRQTHYAQLWAAIAVHVCPFCGQHDLDHPDLPAEDLDHYLTRKIYPFAAANLRNLAPMCSRCNMRYKGTKDVLSGAGALKRHYPYDRIKAGKVELLGSRFFANGDDEPPEWRIKLSPKTKAEEWDRIFCIRQRYRCSILDRRWLDWLAEWVEVLPAEAEATPASLAEHLKTWTAFLRRRGLREKAFLKAAYLRLVRTVLVKGGAQGEQLLEVIASLLEMRRPAAA